MISSSVLRLISLTCQYVESGQAIVGVPRILAFVSTCFWTIPANLLQHNLRVIVNTGCYRRGEALHIATRGSMGACLRREALVHLPQPNRRICVTAEFALLCIRTPAAV